MQTLDDKTELARTLSDLAADVALHFGQLRLLNHMRHYQVDFDQLTPYRYVNPSDWTLDVNELHKDFCIKSGVSHAVLPHAITTLPTGAPSDMVQGHDLLRVLDIGLKGLLKGKRACGERELRSRLRLALEQADLVQSAMHQSITSVIQRFGLPSLLIT